MLPQLLVNFVIVQTVATAQPAESCSGSHLIQQFPDLHEASGSLLLLQTGIGVVAQQGISSDVAVPDLLEASGRMSSLKTGLHEVGQHRISIDVTKPVSASDKLPNNVTKPVLVPVELAQPHKIVALGTRQSKYKSSTDLLQDTTRALPRNSSKWKAMTVLECVPPLVVLFLLMPLLSSALHTRLPEKNQ